MSEVIESATQPPPATAWRKTLLLLTAYLGFISLGLPDTVAGVAWPSVRNSFSLPQDHFGLVFIALGCGYCTSSFLGGGLMSRWGVGTLLTGSSLLVCVAMFGFASAPVWSLFVACAVIWGLGSGGIDSALNSYASTYFSTRHVNWLHACYSVGATVGPLLMTAMIVNRGSWRTGYVLVAVVLLLMSCLFLATRQWWQQPATTDSDPTAKPVGLLGTLRDPLVQLSIVVFFLYTGLEFTVGQWCYTILTESRNVPAKTAGMFAGAYFGAIGVGRVVLGMVADRIGLDRMVRCSLLTAFCGTLMLTVRSPVGVGLAGVLLTGLGLACVFPCLMARTPQRLGATKAAHAIGFQVSAAMLGVALFPGAAGIAARQSGLETIPLIAIALSSLLFLMHEWLIRRGLRSTRPAATVS
ncbi:MFS transporter [Schlesneria sp. T3-172]|uniref:MFS transporter n=1 Tax=Schlesneria sphaerica TaxID=3373610 RepID=UPI0037CA0285